MRVALRRSLLLLLVSVVFAPAAAGAHSNSVDSVPADDARIPTLPRVATVTFNEPVSDAAFALTAPGGQTIKVQVSIDGAVVKATLPEDGTKGDYLLAYRVVSEDGHPVTGEVEFTVTTGRPPFVDESAPTSAGTSTTKSSSFPLWGVIGGAVVLFGIAVLMVRAARR